jgi:hypothetical protein
MEQLTETTHHWNDLQRKVMNNLNQLDGTQPVLPNPDILTSWAVELGRLATNIEQEISSQNFTPSVISSITAITPIVQLLSESLFAVVMNGIVWSKETDEQSPLPLEYIPPGYL